MARATNSVKRNRRRNKILKMAKGYWGRRSKLYKSAKETVEKGLQYAYRDRKQKKRYFRQLWITRISAMCRENGITYSRFMNGLNRAGITINRKALSNMAIEDPAAFKNLIEKAKESLNG